MTDKSEWINKISQRGDKYGSQGGLLDFLSWCKKSGVVYATAEEAKYYYLYPNSSYEEFLKETT